jgi:tetratricopeptide (TPR) repeat protein
MIIDNADTDIVIEGQKEKEKVSLASLLPQTDHGAILITSRDADVARSLVGREKDILAVGTMSDDEAVELLKNHLGDRSTEDAISLIHALDCIPLAIVQAAAYINRLWPRMTVAKYLGEFKTIENQAQLLHKAAVDLRRDEQASNSVLITWQISFNHIRQKRPWAANLLSFMSFFNRQGIPEFMVRHYADKDCEDPCDLSDTCAEEDVDFEEDMAALRAFSLVGTTQCEGEFERHGLVQLATRIWLSSTDIERKWHGAFIQAMAQEFPSGEYANWPKCQTLFSHVFPVVEQESSSKRKIKYWALLLNNAGWYAWRQGLYAQAFSMVSKALEIRREVLDVNNSSTLLSASLLGSILYDLGKYEEAEGMHRQTLATSEKVLGKEHPSTLSIMNNLAGVLDSRGKYEEAEGMHRQTLATREKVLRKEHPDTLSTMNNLAGVLNSRGKYEEAEGMYRQTLATREKVLGKEHPSTLSTMNNLALVLDRQGKYEEAEGMDRQTLATREKVLGKEHPDTLSAMNNLAGVLNSRGKYEEAEGMHRQTLATSEKVLGKEHPNTLVSVYCLAHLLASQHRYGESIILYQRACTGYSAVLGGNHPTTRACYKHYSEMLMSQEEGQPAVPETPDHGVSTPTGKKSKLLRGLAKIGIKSSVFSR